MNKIRNIAAACAVLCLMASEAMSQGFVHDRVVRRNASNGITASRRTAVPGKQRRRGCTRPLCQDRWAWERHTNRRRRLSWGRRGDGRPQEHYDAASDGSVDRQSSASASGPHGSLQTSANYQRNADGGAASTRNTNVTAGNGNTYQAATGQKDPESNMPERVKVRPDGTITCQPVICRRVFRGVLTMRKQLSYVAVRVSLALLLATPFLAAPFLAGQETNRPQRPSSSQVMEFLGNKLQLTTDQKTSIRPIITDRQQQLSNLQGDESLRGLQKARKMKSILEKSDKQINAQLTPAQRKEYIQLKQQMRQQFQERRQSKSSQ